MPLSERGRSPGGGGRNPTPEQIRLETLALGSGPVRASVWPPSGSIRTGDAMVAALTRAGLVRVDHDRVIATA